MRATELAALLAADAECAAKMLLPNGRREGREWVCGSVQGESGDSLKLCIAGNKAGVWKDFSADQSGDLIGLWMAVKGLSLFEACSEAMRHLGIAEASKLPAPVKTYARPSRDSVKPLHDLPMHWLRETRKISEAAIKAYRVAVKGSAIMFPYLRDGELIAAKYRAWNEKKFWTDANCEPCLFGWQAIPKSARSVAICEGEPDALALWDYGFPALSVPYGGGGGDKQQWIAHEYDRLAVYDEIYLCLDQDRAGEEATAEIVNRLGRERCKIVKLPAKDANDCLMAGIEPARIERAFIAAKTQDPEQLRGSAEYADAVWREFQMRESGEIGIRLPWDSLADRLLLRPGEVSVFAGISGHGKSQVTGNIVLGALASGVKSCIASLEFKPEKMLRRLHCQVAAKRHLTESETRGISAWGDGRLWVFDVTGTAKANVILDVFAYAARRYGIKLFLLDNLSKCGFSEDDYDGTKQFIDRLTDLAKRQGIHIMLVHHVRKTEAGEERPPRKNDIKGSGGISDMADTVVIVWRNKPKERELRETGTNASPEVRSRPDCILECVKQREGDSEPTLLLWFDSMSYRYVENCGQIPRRMVECGAPVDESEAVLM